MSCITIKMQIWNGLWSESSLAKCKKRRPFGRDMVGWSKIWIALFWYTYMMDSRLAKKCNILQNLDVGFDNVLKPHQISGFSTWPWFSIPGLNRKMLNKQRSILNHLNTCPICSLCPSRFCLSHGQVVSDLPILACGHNHLLHTCPFLTKLARCCPC